MQTFLSTVSVASPIAMALAALLPILLWAYFKRDKRTRIVVSSIELFRSLPKKSKAKKTFKPPKQFFLELLALSLLCLAALGIYRVHSSERVAILVDTSVSMGATNASGKTLLDSGLAALLPLLQNASSASGYTLFSSSPSLQQHGVTDQALREVLSHAGEELQPIGSGSLQAAVDQLLLSHHFDRLYIVSDRPIDASAVSGTEVETIEVQEKVANQFIEEFRFRDPQQNTVMLRVGSSAPKPSTTTLRLYGSKQIGTKETLLAEKSLRLVPPNAQNVQLPLSSAQQRFGFLRATLSSTSPENNALGIDDNAWIAKNAGSALRILLVGYPTSASGIEQITKNSIVRLSLAEFEERSPSFLSEFDCIVFYGVVPQELPTRPSLFILPPDGISVLGAVNRINGSPQITSWNAEHPLLRYLQVPLLQPAQVLTIEIPAWGFSILNVSQGSIAYAGIQNTVPVAVFGFELLPFEGRKSLASSILLLNSISWLSGSKEVSTSLEIGSSIRLPKSHTWIVRRPDSAMETFIADTERPESYVFTTAGMFVISRATSQKGDVETQILPVQGFTPSESYTWQPPLVRLVASSSAQKVDDTTHQEFWPWLAAGGLFMLVLQSLLLMSKWRDAWT